MAIVFSEYIEENLWETRGYLQHRLYCNNRSKSSALHDCSASVRHNL